MEFIVGKGSTDTEQKKGFSLGVLVGVSFVFLIIGFAGGTSTGPTVKEVLGLSNPKDDLQASADAGPESLDSAAGDASLFMPMAGVFSPDKERFYAEVGEFLVAIRHQGRTRYLQLTVQLVGHDEDYMETVETDVPAIRNGLSIFFTQQEFSSLTTLEGREALRLVTLGEVNKIIGATPEKRVADVFFTEYITQ
jgi:hypothetical protein